tara:strand:- start:694 stop:1122 length:429 start_codon:yes stop_codon:yes gene_type:complete
MPAPTYVSTSGMQKGVETAESGIKIDSIDWSISDEKALAYDRYGGVCGFAHGFNPSVSISISGEISDEEAGLPISQYGTAITIANANNAKLTDPMGADTTADTAFAGVAATGGYYLEDISFSESRDGFRSLSLTAIAYPSVS